MEVLTEARLRSAHLGEDCKEYPVVPGTTVTPSARDYLRQRGITLVTGQEQGMPRSEIPQQGARTYQDALTGAGYAHKPEHMTHLRGNLLVDKSHPRIRLRGSLDLFQARVLGVQVEVQALGNRELTGQLQEVLDYVRRILSAEVREVPLEDIKLFGMDAQRLRWVSHHIEEVFGFPHPTLSWAAGRVVIWLNELRAMARQCELAAIDAFGSGRPDLIQALNRLSSGIYIIMCQQLAQAKEDG